MAHRPRRASQTRRIPIRGEDLSGLNSEVLKLRLGALNLPITGSKGQLQNRLRRALLGNSAKPRSNTANSIQKKRTASRSHVNARPGRSTRNRRNTGDPETLPLRQNSAAVAAASHEQEQEDSALSDNASLSSIEDMIESDVEIDTESQQNTSFSSAQRSAIEEIVSRSVHTALNAFSTPASALSPLASNQTPCTPGTASPLGLSRPVDRNLEDKILRGEYVDLLCYCRTTCISPRPLRFSSVWMTRPQAPWVPRSPWLERKNPSLTRSRNGLTRIWSIC